MLCELLSHLHNLHTNIRERFGFFDDFQRMSVCSFDSLSFLKIFPPSPNQIPAYLGIMRSICVSELWKSKERVFSGY